MTDQPFSPKGAMGAFGRWIAQTEVSQYWHRMRIDTIQVPASDVPGAPALDVDALGVGRVLARTIYGHHGTVQYLSTDAAFSRFSEGYVWMMDRKGRKAVKPGISPINAQVINGGEDEQALADGKRPYTYPWVESVGATSSQRQNITVMGPDERKLQDPYGITVRGSSFGMRGNLEDHFFFPEDHYHISDHRGPATGYSSPNDVRSTRIYDINQEGEPSRDTYRDGKLVQRGYNKGLDRVFVVHRDAAECAGGNPQDMNLAFNLSGRTGFAYGLSEMRASGKPFYTAKPPADPRETATEFGEDDHSTAPTGVVQAVLATMAYERGGPFSPGVGHGDKHHYATNKDGLPYVPVHIHINAKYTNESVVFDGRRNMIPAYEPKVGRGLIPVRSWEMFNKDLSDPFFCKSKPGGWDFHTRINSIPIWPRHPTVPPVVPPTIPPPITPTPPTVPRHPTTPDTPKTPGSPETPAPPAIPPTTGTPSGPITPSPPVIGAPGAATTPNDGQGGDRVPDDWGPAEAVRPSYYLQPRPGNIEAPNRYNSPQRDAGGESPSGAAAESRLTQALNARAASGYSEQDRVTLGINGLSFTDNMKAPRTAHLFGFYRHKNTSPRAGMRGLSRYAPDYTTKPTYREGDILGEPKAHEWGSADGVNFWAPPELESWDAQKDDADVDYDLSTSTFALWGRSSILGFGYASDDWGDVVSGHRIELSNDGVGDLLEIKGVDGNGDLDYDRPVSLLVPLKLGILSTTARDAMLTDRPGMVIYNSTTGTFQGRDASDWIDFGGGGEETGEMAAAPSVILDADQDDWDLGTTGLTAAMKQFYVGPTADGWVVNSIENPGAICKMIRITNVSDTYSFDIADEGSGDAENRVITGLGIDYTVVPLATAVLVYDTNDDRWRIDA